MALRGFGQSPTDIIEVESDVNAELEFGSSSRRDTLPLPFLSSLQLIHHTVAAAVAAAAGRSPAICVRLPAQPAARRPRADIADSHCSGECIEVAADAIVAQKWIPTSVVSLSLSSGNIITLISTTHTITHHKLDCLLHRKRAAPISRPVMQFTHIPN